MNRKARNELIEVISGLVMLVAGIFLFVSKTKIVSGFLGGNDTWKNWQRLVALFPLIVGIIMMVIKPKLRLSKIISFIGVMTIIVILFIDTTIIIVKEIKVFEWIMDSILIVGGIAIIFFALFSNKKKTKKES